MRSLVVRIFKRGLDNVKIKILSSVHFAVDVIVCIIHFAQLCTIRGNKLIQGIGQDMLMPSGEMGDPGTIAALTDEWSFALPIN